MQKCTTETRPNVDLEKLAAQRLAYLRGKLSGAPFDTLILSSPENVHYATGYHSAPAEFRRSYPMAVILSVDKLVAVLPTADTAAAAAEGIHLDDIVPFGEFYFSGNSAFASLSDRHKGISEAMAQGLAMFPQTRVGVEDSSLDVATMEHISRWGSDVYNVDSWILEVRSQKLAGEVELLRHASDLAQRGIEAALDGAGTGISEKELSAEVAGVMASGGGHPRNLTVAGGERSAISDAMSNERRLVPGDLLRFDVGCTYYGYQSDMARTAVVGGPTELQQQRCEALLAGLDEELTVIKPGIEARDVYRAAVQGVERAGLTPYRRHHVGHAIGLVTYEYPVITAREETMIQSGATFSLETPYYEPGWGGLIVEDTGVVTDNGFERFTTTDRTLRVISE